jgi:hypothetical protein
MMKAYILLIMVALVGISAKAQQPVKEESEKILGPGDVRRMENEQKERDAIFNDPDFKIVSVPEEWDAMSAVVLCQKVKYVYDRKFSSLIEKQLIHRRIKLQDKAAVEFFSKFYMVDVDFAGIRIIKPSKEEIDIDLNGADVITNVEKKSISGFYMAYTTARSYKTRVAIPGLEVGDIIDYFIEYETIASVGGNHIITMAMGTGTVQFDPIILELASEYPIVSQTITFEVENKFYVNFISLNGAPKLESRKEDKKYVYQLKDRMRGKLSKEYWNYVYRSEPTIKFQVIYSSMPEEKTPYLFGTIGIPKSSSTPEEVGRKINYGINNTPDGLKLWSKHFYTEVCNYLQREHVPKTDKKAILKDAYYYLRDITKVKMFPLQVGITSIITLPEPEASYLYEFVFFDVMKAVCIKYNIPYTVIAGVPRNIGVLDELIISREIEKGLKIDLDKTYYLFTFTEHSHLGEVSSVIEGIEAYDFKPLKKAKELKVDRITVPVSEASDNKYKEITDLAIDENMELVKMNREVKLTGAARYDYYDKALFWDDYAKSELAAYNRKYAPNRPSNKERLAEMERRERDELAEMEEKRIKNLKEDLERQKLDVKLVEGFELISTGRTDSTPVFDFKFKATIENLIQKAGPNLILNIGEVIGSQIELDAEDMQRKSNIYQSFKRTYEDMITFTIPEGYKVDEIKQLDFNVDNESASFISQASMEGNKLIIKVTKTYKKQFDKKNNWSNYIDVLEVAYGFYQKKVVLKKV